MSNEKEKEISCFDKSFGIIMKKVKKEKAIQIFNEKIQKKEKLKKKNNISSLNMNSINKNTSEVVFHIKEEKSKRESTKDLITNNFFTNKKGIHEFKFEVGEQENESKNNLDQMYLNAGVEKDILLNLINKQTGRSFVCPSDNITKDFKSTTLIGNDEKETTKRRRTSTFQKAQTFFNHYFQQNDKLKNIIKNDDRKIIRNKSSTEFCPCLNIYLKIVYYLFIIFFFFYFKG